MNQIRDWLFIGGYWDTKNTALLLHHNVTAMLQLADNVAQDGVTSLYLPVEDGYPLPDGALAKGIAFVREQKAASKTILVACGAGISRSTTFAIGALKEEEGGTVLENYLKIREKHENALPHMSLWHSLNQHYGEDTLYQDIWQHLPRK